jgi:ATP-dependent DNA helicase RecG
MSADWNHKNNENARIDPQNARIGPENARIEPPNPWVMAKNKRINDVKYLHENGAMTAITSSAIIEVLEDLRENQVISTQDVQKILDCKETKALRIITEMRKANIIVAITGQGKGRYILNQ